MNCGEKGKTSGETFDLLEIRVNCEQNSVLYVVRPVRGGSAIRKTERENRATVIIGG